MNNNRPLFIASFMTLIAAGVGFAIRNAILGEWGAQFDFTKTELGQITGMGLAGFGLTIIACSFFVDKVGYKSLMISALLLHVLSAVVTLAATPAFGTGGPEGSKRAYWCLYIGSLIFSLGNGLCEAVINPLVATLYSRQKTHYLNILHAGWPGGLIVGGLIAYAFSGESPAITHLRWEVLMAMFLIPTLVYGIIVLREKFPVSEARAAGVTYATMLAEFASPILLLLLFLHALVGYVELGTDSWITNIMTNVIPGNAVLLFVYTSALMFILRFFAGPIVEHINPVGLLLASACLGAAGLYLLGTVSTGIAVVGAATVYGLGKTFLWPTMLGVVGERFPRGGALTMGTMGGIGMLSAGLLAGPGIGYTQDFYASKQLQTISSSTYEDFKSPKSNSFLMFPPISGIDASHVAELEEKLKAEKTGGAPVPEAQKTEFKEVSEANLYGGRMALKVTALVPMTMAVGYLILVIYFNMKGGYRAEVLHGAPPDGEVYTGGVEGPVE